MEKVKILIVEDELLVAEDLAVRLRYEGYEICGIASNMDDAMDLFKEHTPDLVLLDISIHGERTGIDIAYAINELLPTPFIYITAHADAMTVNSAKETFPAAYVIKPFTTSSLLVSIELAIHNFAYRKDTSATPEDAAEGNIYLKQNYVFVKDGHRFVKLFLNDILYLVSEDNYVRIATREKSLLIRNTLSKTMEVLKNSSFVRVHRSYCINANHIQSFTENEITIGADTIPVGRIYKEELVKIFGFR
jgi:two-component system, response regulator PdtaR